MQHHLRIVFYGVVGKDNLSTCSGNKTSLKTWLNRIKVEVFDHEDACAGHIKA